MGQCCYTFAMQETFVQDEIETQKMVSESDSIRIVGARTNNLKNVDVCIPKNSLVAITGRSGSGKTSLAIDTLFAEGQRQYIESLSLGSQQLFQQGMAADVDSIVGLQPTVCINQRRGSPNPRSTVGTLSEIHDYLRLLYAKAGTISCVGCGETIAPTSVQQIVDRVLNLPESTKAMILAPIAADSIQAAIERVRKERLVRIRINGEMHDIERLRPVDNSDEPSESWTVEAVADRIIVRDGIDDRLFESVELANKIGNGRVVIEYKDADQTDWSNEKFSTQHACSACGTACPVVQPRLFSFNSPHGACGNCKGVGHLDSFNMSWVVPDRNQSVKGGAIVAWSCEHGPTRSKLQKELSPILKAVGLDVDQPLSALSESDWQQFVSHEEIKMPGLSQVLEREYTTAIDDDWLDHLESFRSHLPCPKCDGTRLNPHANAVAVAGRNISELCGLPLDETVTFLQSLEFEDSTVQEIAQPIVNEICLRVEFLLRVGLHYLSLHREADTLSGGELQRVRLAKSIGNGLVGTCYVLDEPSCGLHPRDTEKLIELMGELRERGNTVVVVEHDESIVLAADHAIEIGPEAGVEGGRMVFAGSPAAMAANPECLTGKYISGDRSVELTTRSRMDDSGSLRIEGAEGFNLQKVDAEIPLRKLVCVTGVSGSGKSTLVARTLVPAVKEHLEVSTIPPEPFAQIHGLEQVERLVQIDQRPLSRSPRGCAATYSGAFTEIRKLFAKTRAAKQLGFNVSRFSFNAKPGRCSTCAGKGSKRVSMKFMPDLLIQCESCNGKRYNTQTLQARFRGLDISEVLELTIAEALDVFLNVEPVRRILQNLNDVGLGYLKMGQPATHLSGGEAQRVKLATELVSKFREHTLYVLDEPTAGLHSADVQQLMTLLNSLVEAGNSVVVVEHNLAVVRNADWVIDLGPGGGSQGGRIVGSGTPQELAEVTESHTGQFLRPFFA